MIGFDKDCLVKPERTPPSFRNTADKSKVKTERNIRNPKRDIKKSVVQNKNGNKQTKKHELCIRKSSDDQSLYTSLYQHRNINFFAVLVLKVHHKVHNYDSNYQYCVRIYYHRI